MSGEETEDCLSCRLIGGCSFLGISAYIYYNSRDMRPRSKVPMIVISCLFGSVGLVRLLGVRPFKNT